MTTERMDVRRQGSAGPTSRDSGPAPSPELVTELTRLLARALRALGDAGRPVDASRLAASGWSALRHDHPVDAERLNGLMHYLARLPEQSPVQAQHTPDTQTE